MKDNRHIFSMLSALLDYPDQSLIDGLAEISTGLLTHQAFPPETRTGLSQLVTRLSTQPLMDTQEEYIETFERGRATSLYLFEHVHGESRERGQAMVDLLAMYETKGLFLDRGELPDYLPVFLEFLAQETPAEAYTLLGEITDVIRAIATQLAEHGTPYSSAVAALLPLAGAAPLAITTLATESPTSQEIDRQALDKEWQDESVSFLGAQAPMSGSAQPIQFYKKRPAR